MGRSNVHFFQDCQECVIVTTQKTIDLVFHTQVFKLQRARETPSRS